MGLVEEHTANALVPCGVKVYCHGYQRGAEEHNTELFLPKIVLQNMNFTVHFTVADMMVSIQKISQVSESMTYSY